MKHKFSKILGVGLTLALLASMLVMATPVSAEEEPNYIGVALDEQDYGTVGILSSAQWVEDSTLSGNYAVELDTGLPLAETAVDAALVVLSYNQALSTITELGYSFKQSVRTGCRQDDSAPYIVLSLDTDETLGADTFVVHHMFWTEIDNTDVWETWTLSDGPLDISKMATDAIVGETAYMWHVEGPGVDPAEWGGDPAHVQWEDVTTVLGDCTVLEIKVEVGEWQSNKQEAHNIDDITINDTTYDLEPILLDAEYYQTGTAPTVTVCNGAEAGTGKVQVSLLSNLTEHSTNILASEISGNPGVFEGSFTLVDTWTGVNQLMVLDGETFTASYTGDWGADPQTVTASATVDDTAPVVEITSPLDTYVKGNVEINADITETNPFTAVMEVDVVEETGTTDPMTYTWATDAADDGSHTILVTVTDGAGNVGSDSITVTVDNTLPEIKNQKATPPVVKPDEVNTIVFTADVIDAEIDTVKINLSSISGPTAKPMLDDGDDPDEVAGDGTYTAELTTTITLPGKKDLTITATDKAGNSETAVIELGVSPDTIKPVIAEPAITYPFGMSSALSGDTVTLFATVTDNIKLDTVTAACAEFVGEPANMLDDGKLLDEEAGDNIFTGTATVAGGTAKGSYPITITATDAEGNVETDETLILKVDPEARGGVEVILAEGWNLISLPLIQDDDAIGVVLADISDSIIMIRYYYNRGPEDQGWLWYQPGVAESTLETMEDGKGYWIYMSSADELYVSGREMPLPPEIPPVYPVEVGWNLIGFKSLDDLEHDEYLCNLVEASGELLVILDYSVLWGYDPAEGYFNVYPILDHEGNMEAGHGYWLWMKFPGLIIPPA